MQCGMKFQTGGWSLTTESRLLNWELLGNIRICIITAIYCKPLANPCLINPTFQYKMEVYFTINLRLITHPVDIETENVTASVLFLSILLQCTLLNC